MSNVSDPNDRLGNRSKDSSDMIPYWDLTDDLVAGEDAMRAQGEKYLPKFNHEDQKDFDARLKYVKLTNVYRDTTEALSSKPFEEEVTIVGDNLPTEIEQFAENVDGSGTNLTAFAAETFFNGINSAVDWIFIDYPALSNEERPRTRQQEIDAGVRPYWTHVLGRNILEVRWKIINGVEVLEYIRIWEPGSPNQVRVFERTATGVTWTLYDEKIEGGRKTYVQNSAGTVTIGEIPLVPFATGRRDGKRYFYRPVMRDAADLQRNVYRSESSLEWAKVMTAYPMLTANGVKPEKDAAGNIKPIYMGPRAVLYAPPDGNGQSGEWKWIEPSSESLKFLESNIEKTIQNLRELGRQPLTAQSGNLTVITTAVAAGKAKSAVQAWANVLKNVLENALVLTAKYMNLQGYDPEVRVFDEFDNFADSASDLTALSEARKNGDISLETYHAELKRRRVLSAEFDHGDELARLLKEVPGEDEDLNDDGSLRQQGTIERNGEIVRDPPAT